ncbi:hypothetical protein A2311_06560 [candidate division WOR-1 bacterium RIFOXYB2_FULL_48_7]|uniref:Uncharacterized protein n=1 Tax=candidate division WOR-1 bacterium RIFOXYB2_FULL_48_7 TaxID=1802583 RepID=A0A1F4TBI3_UNCSA|nr:MAG: hypothetical protein A2311_06560 [candidate division WOR-1 bacterium RIFOXYB2_FULL_48_7]
MQANGEVIIHDRLISIRQRFNRQNKYYDLIASGQLQYRRFVDRLEIAIVGMGTETVLDCVGLGSDGMVRDVRTKQIMAIRRQGYPRQKLRLDFGQRGYYVLGDIFAHLGTQIKTVTPATANHQPGVMINGKVFSFPEGPTALITADIEAGNVICEANRSGLRFFRRRVNGVMSYQLIGEVSISASGRVHKSSYNIFDEANWVLAVAELLPEFGLRDLPVGIYAERDKKGFRAARRYQGIIFSFPSHLRSTLSPLLADGEIYLRVGLPGKVQVVRKNQQTTDILGEFNFDTDSGQVYSCDGEAVVFQGSNLTFCRSREKPVIVGIDVILPDLREIVGKVQYEQGVDGLHSRAIFRYNNVTYTVPCHASRLCFEALNEGRMIYKVSPRRIALVEVKGDHEEIIGSFKLNQDGFPIKPDGEPYFTGGRPPQKSSYCYLGTLIPKTLHRQATVNFAQDRGRWTMQVSPRQRVYLDWPARQQWLAAAIAAKALLVERNDREIWLLYSSARWGRVMIGKVSIDELISQNTGLRTLYDILKVEDDEVAEKIDQLKIEISQLLFKGELSEAIRLINVALALTMTNPQLWIDSFSQLISDLQTNKTKISRRLFVPELADMLIADIVPQLSQAAYLQNLEHERQDIINIFYLAALMTVCNSIEFQPEQRKFAYLYLGVIGARLANYHALALTTEQKIEILGAITSFLDQQMSYNNSDYHCYIEISRENCLQAMTKILNLERKGNKEPTDEAGDEG